MPTAIVWNGEVPTIHRRRLHPDFTPMSRRTDTPPRNGSGD